MNKDLQLLQGLAGLFLINIMEVIRKFFPHIRSAFSIVAMIAIWLMFAPVQAGGLASYVVVIGKSMEPRYHVGDLVIAHQQDTYQVGDAVVYRNEQLASFIFHRIITEDNERYTLQGDNNSWVDTYQPAKTEILGKLWLYVPRGGAAIKSFRNPYMMAAFAAIFGAFLVNNMFDKKSRGNKSMNTKSVRAWIALIQQNIRNWLVQNSVPQAQRPSSFDPGSILETSFFTLGLILLSSLIIGIISFSRPTSRSSQDSIQYQHLGIFSYLAAAPQGVYDSNTIISGDPIFPRLTCTVDVSLQYTLIAPDAKEITGTYQLTALVREQTSGWQREIPLQEEIAFSGTAFGTTASLDLCKAESLIQSMETETDFHPGVYMLSVTPKVNMNGQVAGQAMAGSFDSGLTFVYDRIHFYLLQDENLESPLSITKAETMSDEHREINTIAFLGAELPVPALRWAAVIGLIASLGGFLCLGLKLQEISQTDQEKFYRVKYDSVLVDVQTTDSFGTDHIDVTSMDALAKLAERFGTMILHAAQGNVHRYYVQSGETTYRFSLVPNATGSTFPANETMNQESRS